jgi:superfamily II DNA or RNA helicase
MESYQNGEASKEHLNGISPEVGQVVLVRTRTYLVDEVVRTPNVLFPTLVKLVCVDDDAQGQPLAIIWELELEKKIIDREAWKSIGTKGFDSPRFFGAYVRTLRWNCVTATDPKLFQSPFRAGIRIDAYQLEPLRKALALPRVNLLIADDVGLGKTIEAGLIASELLLRRRVREIVIACPPSMLRQWQEEMESRFGLIFEILDRDLVEKVRQERGFGINPWTTYPRFLISTKLLVSETHAGPLRTWLGSFRPSTLFILDEAHHAAPSSGAKYAIDSKITKAVRDLAPRFEHRLFLSATPHNGHSNSFSALLELLDPQRFTRGVKVAKRNLDAVMVRRLKEDVRELFGGFPKREIVQIDITGLPARSPELELSRLLDVYRQARQDRLKDAAKRQQAEATLLICHLQQRLLSSIEGFAKTLAVHRRTMERIWTKDVAGLETKGPVQIDLLSEPLDGDDDRSLLPEKEQELLLDQQVEEITLRTAGTTDRIERERSILAEMASIGEGARGIPDARVRHLIDWIRRKMCSGVHLPHTDPERAKAKWNELRVLIFTEYDDTLRYIHHCLRSSIEGTDRAEERIAIFHGPTPSDRREAIKLAFNEQPSKNPLRILLATDAAREGLNLQAHCHNLFHFDVPWNPSRLEQRNGRIDRKLQPAEIVYCHYFVYSQRPEDRVLRALVNKTGIIRRELGSLAQVIEERLARTLKGGIVRSRTFQIAQEIEATTLDRLKQATVEQELEDSRGRQETLRKEIDTVRSRLQEAREWIGLDNEQLREALSCSLEIMGVNALTREPQTEGPEKFFFPNLDKRYGGDPAWVTTLDTLRVPPQDGVKGCLWRKGSPIRPVVFESPDEITNDVVQLHLQHRIVQRLLGRFSSQGFVHCDLSRTCVAQTNDAVPRVVLLGRLALYGLNAVRLHQEMLIVSARWTEASIRSKPLSPYGQAAEEKALSILDKSLSKGAGRGIPESVKRQLQAAVAQDVGELLGHLENRGQEARLDAQGKLLERGRIEADAMIKILEDQRLRVSATLSSGNVDQLLLELSDAGERKQLEANRRYWLRWLENVEGDLKREPSRIRDSYRVTSYRIEPVGLAYLWPMTG